MTLAPGIADKVRASFARQGLMARFEAEILSVVAGAVRIAAPLTPEVSQQHGAGHAGLTFALGDSAAGYAALTLLPEDAEVMTAEMKINLLRPAVGDQLVAHCRAQEVDFHLGGHHLGVLRQKGQRRVSRRTIAKRKGQSRMPGAVLLRHFRRQRRGNPHSARHDREDFRLEPRHEPLPREGGSDLIGNPRRERHAATGTGTVSTRDPVR